MSHFAPEVSPLQEARDAYAEALALGDSAACSEAMEKIVRLNRAAAAPSPQMLKGVGPNPFSGPPLLDRFVTKKCATCREEFQTRSERTRCDNCLTKPRPTVY